MASGMELDGYNFEPLDHLLSIAFIHENENEADLFRGPTFGVWGLRNEWESSLNDESSYFNNYRKSSVFCFKNKHLHFAGINTKAIACMTACNGIPISATEVGSIDSFNTFLNEIDQGFDDSYFVRYIPAPRARDALALSSNERSIFIPIMSGVAGDLQQLSLQDYLTYSGLGDITYE